MLTKLQSNPAVAALVTALSVVGCATALAVTGHISGSDALGVFGVVLGGSGAVGVAHVVGNQVTQAAALPTAPPVSSASVAQPAPTAVQPPAPAAVA